MTMFIHFTNQDQNFLLKLRNKRSQTGNTL